MSGFASFKCGHMSIPDWVRDIGWGAEYARAFDTLGMETVADLALLDDDLRGMLKAELSQVAKPFQVAKFMKLVADPDRAMDLNGKQC